jgi:hypothetical protein
MSCTEWEREIAGETESLELDEHLRVCSNCREFAREIAANRAALGELQLDGVALATIRRGVLDQIERGRRRGAWAAWSVAAAACVAAIFAASALLQFRNPAPPKPVEFAKNPPKIEWTPRVRPLHNFGPVVAQAAPAQKPEPLVVKMLTNDPNVIIIWLVDKKGDSL